MSHGTTAVTDIIFFTEVHRRTLDRLCQYALRSLPGRWLLRSTGTSRLLVPHVKRSTVGNCAFPKTWNILLEDVTSSQSEVLNTPFATSSKRGFSRSLFQASSADTDCILTFSLGLSVPTLRRFCRLRTTIMTMIMSIAGYLPKNRRIEERRNANDLPLS